MFQYLETRRLLTNSLNNGVLAVFGTDSSDTIEISRSIDSIIVSQTHGGTESYPASAVSRILIDAKAGADRVTIATSITKPSSILGQSGNDTLTGGNGADTMDGGSGNDVLSGRAGNDSLRGGSNNDAVVGGSGNDRLDGGSGADFLDGQAGSDTVLFSRSTSVNAFIEIRAGASGNATIAGRGITDGDNFSSIERLNGGSADDTLAVNVNDPAFSLPSNVNIGAFELIGGTGNDDLSTLNAGFANRNLGTVALRGGDGDDTLRFYELQDLNGSYLGEAGNDMFRHGGESVTRGVDGGAGMDTETVSVIGAISVSVSPGIERFESLGNLGVDVVGNELDNTIILNSPGTIDGRGGNDLLLNNGDGPGRFIGGAGNDTMLSGAGDNALIGGPGNDTYVFGDVIPANGEPIDNDLIVEAADDGNDSLDFSLLTTAVRVTLQPSGTQIAAHTNRVVRIEKTADALNFENVLGGAANDFLFGNTRSNKLLGRAGNDSLYGIGGNDTLDGGSGSDRLFGGNGADQIFGGSGADKLFGEGGADFLSDRDGTRDTLDGGGGTDSARRDSIDSVVSIESFV